MTKIKKQRENLGLTQVEVAREVGVTINSYRRWEQGVTNPKPENKDKLEDVLGIKLDQSA